MKKYTKIYYDYFGYCIEDIVPCEVCSRKSVDIHHIEARSKRKDLENDITNLMALCREHHIEYGDKKNHKEYLQKIHDKWLR